MPDDVDNLQGVSVAAHGHFASVLKQFCVLILRRCINLVGSSLKTSFTAQFQPVGSRDLASMAAMDPIDISSSDSDLEIEDIRKGDGSSLRGSLSSRVLPPWASRDGPEPRRTGHYGQFQKEAFRSNGSSSTASRILPAKAQTSSSSDQARAVNYSIANNSGADYEKISSQQALDRTLPSSFQPSFSAARASNSVENIRAGQLHDDPRGSYYSAGPSSSSSNGAYMRDHFRGSDDVYMYENSRSRVLPPSLVHAKSSSTTQFASSSDPIFRPGIAEERTAAADERLIYQAALEDLNQPKIEVELPEGLLSVSLLRHQKIALAWMLQKETRSLHCLGGILADDQGLGKTISIIALIQMQKTLQANSKSENVCNRKTEALNLDDDEENVSTGLDKGKTPANMDREPDDIKSTSQLSSSTRAFNRRRPAAGTLVVCPASVLRQWARELDEKIPGEAKLSVLTYHGGNRTRDPHELAGYDVVLTTYSIVTNEVPKQPKVDEDEVDERDMDKHGLSSEFSFNKKRKKTSDNGKKGKKSRKGAGSSSIDSDCGPLAKVGWFRVVLDEAQTIKNHRTQVARACCSLRAKRRWCLSGTPIQNTIDDLYSYFRFLRYDPYAAYKSFYHTIKVPISRNSIQGYKKLQAVLRAIMLRRTKETLIDGKPIIMLPPKTIRLNKVEFSTEERAFYSQLEAETRSQFKAYHAAGTVNQNYANILLMLLRLRQACDHPLLVRGANPVSIRRDTVDIGSDSMTMAKSLPPDMLRNLLDLFERGVCQLCGDTPENPVATMCGHVFCYQCVSEYLTGDDNMCPAYRCKEQLGTDIVFSKETLRRCLYNHSDDRGSNSPSADESIVLRHEYSSSKIKAVLEILQSLSNSPVCGSVGFDGDSFSDEVTCKGSSSFSVSRHTTIYSNSQSDDTVKVIIFSQWTSMLDLVEYSLRQNCIHYRRLDGTMSLASRDKAVREFNSDPEVTVMLMSLKAGNLGLNMVAACHVILLDLWWNPTTEDQAVDRAHRIGQTRPVTVTRLTIKDTVEDRILSLQEEKKKMVASAFGEDHGGGSATRLTVEDLKYLFMV